MNKAYDPKTGYGDYVICDHCGIEVPEVNIYETANGELVCDYTEAVAPLVSCRDFLTDEEVRNVPVA